MINEQAMAVNGNNGLYWKQSNEEKAWYCHTYMELTG